MTEAMDRASLRARQAPLKARYREDPGAARVTARAQGQLHPGGVGCTLTTMDGRVEAGLHPATGGTGAEACSADILLQALVGCAGVTLGAVSLALGVPLRGGRITAEGKWDARGTLAVESGIAVGMTDILLRIEIDSDASDAQLVRLLELTERYCVVLQTLAHPPTVHPTLVRAARQAAAPDS